jgi:hypothetical protein
LNATPKEYYTKSQKTSLALLALRLFFDRLKILKYIKINMNLPFEPMPQIKRYLEEILYSSNNFFSDSPIVISIESFLPDEDITDKSVIVNDTFWQYMEKEKVVKLIKSEPSIIEFPNMEEKNPLVFSAKNTLKILDIKKIKEIYFNLFEKDKPISLEGKEIKFIENESAIYVNLRKSEIPPNTHKFYFCKFIFSQQHNFLFDWSEIADEIYGEDSEFQDAKKKRGVYDTMNAINRKIQADIPTDDELFTMENQTIKRNF